jgi:hypothetical protein
MAELVPDNHQQAVMPGNSGPSSGSYSIYDQMRQDLLKYSLAIQAGIAPTTPDMAEVAHKIVLMDSKNPGFIGLQIANSGFSNLMQDVFGSMAKEMEAPERMLAAFPAYAAQKRSLFLEYRMCLAEMLCCDGLDLRNPRYLITTQALSDQFEYQIARTNRDFGTTEREYQAQNLSTSTTKLEEMRQPVVEQKRRRGLMGRLSIFGGR